MKKVAWVTDSTACLDNELKVHPDVYTIPMTILLDDEEYLDNGIDLTAEELYQKIKTLKSPPKTSQPSVGAFSELFKKLQKDYDSIICVLVSSKLSGTVASCELAARDAGIEVTVIDSKILTFPLTVQLKKGMEWLSNGLTIEEVKDRVERLSETYEFYVLIGSLEQLHRSGRMSGLQFFLGSVLNIKPIIQIDGGVLSTKEKVRSEKKAKDKIVKYLQTSYEKYEFDEVYLLYGLHDQDALEWKKELEITFPKISFNCYPIGATIGVHAGEHTLGIAWYNG